MRACLEVDLDNTEAVHSGKTAIKISYNARDNWYGVGFVDPANDWGGLLGGYDLSRATAIPALAFQKGRSAVS